MDTKIELERIKFGCSKSLGLSIIKSLKLKETRDRITNGFIFTITGYVLANKILDRMYYVRFDVPKDWWQMFKGQYFPKWLLKKYPVKKKTIGKRINTQTYQMFPMLDFDVGAFKDYTIYQTLNEYGLMEGG